MKISKYGVTLGLLSASVTFASDQGDLKNLIYVVYSQKPHSGQTVTLQASELQQLTSDYDVDAYISGIDKIELTSIDEKKSATGDALQVKILTKTHHTLTYDFDKQNNDDGGGDGGDAGEDGVIRVDHNSTIEIFQPTTQVAIDRVNEQAKLIASGLAQKIYGLFDKGGETVSEAQEEIDEVGDDRADMIARINRMASETPDKPVLEAQFNGISTGVNAIPFGLDVSSVIVVPGVTHVDGDPTDDMILSVSREAFGTHVNPLLKFFHKIPPVVYREEMMF